MRKHVKELIAIKKINIAKKLAHTNKSSNISVKTAVI